MNRRTPKAIIAALSKLSGPSREIDDAIYYDLLGNKRDERVCKKCGNPGWVRFTPTFTADISSAAQLIPSGWEWVVRSGDKDSTTVTGFANVHRQQNYGKKTLTALRMKNGRVTKEAAQNYRMWSTSSYAATPATALCQSALKARFNVAVKTEDSGRPVPKGRYVSKDMDQFMDVVIKGIVKTARKAKNHPLGKKRR